MLKLQNLETFFGPVQALRGVSLALNQGQIVTILGPNGAGKSTILNTLMGVLDHQPEKGNILFMGKEIQGLRTEKIVRMGISYVPEGREIFPQLSVHENLLVGAYTQSNRSQIRADMEQMFAYFPVLASRRKQLAGTLSGGEQQMLAIARALMNRPKLLLLDEPSLGLAPLLVKEIFRIIVELREAGLSILLVEQNARMVLEIADYGYVLENGRMVVSGPAANLQQDEDVREFYLGIKREHSAKGYQRYQRKKRWN